MKRQARHNLKQLRLQNENALKTSDNLKKIHTNLLILLTKLDKKQIGCYWALKNEINIVDLVIQNNFQV